MEENVKRVVARPFSGSHEKMVRYFDMGFKLDYPKIHKWLAEQEASREKEVLEFQIARYEKWLKS